MTKFGVFSFLGRGHLDPAIAVARGLRARGHEATLFHLTVAQAAVRDAGLRFHPIDQQETPSSSRESAPRRHSWLSTVEAVTAHATRTLREGLAAVQAARVDAVVADQLDVAAGTVAEKLSLPFVTLSCAPPLYLDDTVPPPYFGWRATVGAVGRRRNARANAFVDRLASPIIATVNAQRLAWGLPAIERVNDLFSKRAIVTQLPRALELPRRVPPQLHYAAQFRDECVEARIRFDWAALTSRPLVFASMGTIRNQSADVFRTIIAACAAFDVQLVLSLGGGRVSRNDLGPLPSNATVVAYAPQRALLRRATFAINCAGLNTTLECLRNGVPIVAIPVGEDQPGVAARIAHANVGIVMPVRQLSVETLKDAISRLTAETAYRTEAARVQQHLQQLNGVERAVDAIESALSSVSLSIH